MSIARNRVLSAFLALFLLQPLLQAQEAQQQEYRLPPQQVLDILDAPPSPNVAVSPNRKWLTISERQSDETTIAELAEPMLMLAGQRFKQYPNDRIEDTGITRITFKHLDEKYVRELLPPEGGFIADAAWTCSSPENTEMAYTVVHGGTMSLHIYDAAKGVSRPVSTPGLAGKIAHLNFTHDGRYLAFTVTHDKKQYLWLADVSAGTARQVPGVELNHVVSSRCSWSHGQPPLICQAVPSGRGEPPPANEVPKGPIVQESYGRKAAARTYQDLLKSPHDEALFEYYYTNQIVAIEPDGRTRPLGEPGLHVGVDPSPDGRYLLVRTVHRPYSYQVPMSQFPRRTAVWDRTGKEVRLVDDAPLRDNIPSARDATIPGIRVVNWRADAPATLVLVEALDGGDPNKQVPKRDRISLLEAPFNKPPVTFAETEMRYGGLHFAFPDLAFLTERSSRTARTRTWILDPSRRGSAPRLLWDRSSEDRYSDPGQVVSVPHPTEPRSVPLLSPDRRYLYLAGSGAAPDGARPFLDRLDLKTLRTERLWRSSPPHYESVIAVLDPLAQRLVFSRESPTQWPNYFVLSAKAGETEQLTELPDPAPWFSSVKGELIRYKRADGIDLSATLYLPAGYDPQRDGPLPFFFWAYPREFLTETGASQLTGSPYEFKRPRRSDHLLLLALGYGVLDGPSMPIVGKDGSEPNDTYVEQLVAGAQAAVDTLVERGLADPDRIGVGGHSYGAFMTANLLAHSDIFRAGIARSGAYNRTLTPFGFQAEPRTYWQAPEVYNAMSPFMNAHKINEPLLLIHGMRDSNQGTFPIQSERMFAALKGNGGNVRYVQLPLEDHGYQARESRRHAIWEMVNWLERYVKNAPPRETRVQ